MMMMMMMMINVEQLVNENWQGKPKYSEKTYPNVTLSTTIPHDLTWARTRAATVGSRRLTA
jgi:hypothetical protein